ncbi:hypothetical protein PIL02S_06779 [Paenibacillus illinoisensis]|uniref:Uncharacterized protein n=1 Tax=Paenibacillus illinoisensis TaxID=59845 RepID=A0A2W0CA05_9BACL|nr:hypothetical protein PIL02S_06779 [Paenibacillus illinoisensis]
MKYGAPITDVTIPAGTSRGIMRIRPTISPRTISMAPITAAMGRRHWFCVPTSVRAICGASRPMNPMAPTADTEAPARQTESKSNHNRSRRTRSPSEMLIASPTSKIFSFLALPMAIVSIRRRSGASGRNCSQPLPQRLPDIQSSAMLTLVG